MSIPTKTSWIIVTTVVVLTLLDAQGWADAEKSRHILDATGIKGGLIAHIGCGDGKLTAALNSSNSYLIHGLDADAENVHMAREYVQSLGAYGKVSVDFFDGKQLPYVDNLVNLVVSEDLGKVSMDEIMRVLAPNGVAYVKIDDNWKKTVKLRPPEIDEWTHYLYDSTNNAVSKDSVVGPPHQLQWVAGPAWARSHDHLASASAAVSSGGRIFYILDEGPTAAVVLKPKWHLVARDAFSGVFLWKRPIPKWQQHLRGFRSGPSDLSRRLVAIGDCVYATLAIQGPLCAIDAATGQTLRTYEQTNSTLEVVYDKGTLFVVAGEITQAQTTSEALFNKKLEYLERPPLKRIVAIDAESGRILWSKSDSDTQELMPTTLAVSQGRVFFQNPDEIVCLDAQSGEGIWRAQRPVSRSRPAWSAPTLVTYEDVLLSADRAVAEEKTRTGSEQRKVEWLVSSDGGKIPVGELIAFSAVDGKRLWSCESQECFNAPVDVLVADGLVWTGNLVWRTDPGITKGRNPRTGQIERTRPPDQDFFEVGMFHHRCFRNKATNRYLVLGRSGIEFIDLATGEGIPNHWVRGTCQYGVMPCNGLLYAPPHSCACFIRAKLNGFNCMAPRPRPRVAQLEAAQVQAQPRLQRGSAYGEVKPASEMSGESGDWPTYRHDAARSGRSPDPVASKLKKAWRTQLGGRLSSVVVAEGRLFVAQVETHTVQALETDSGRKVWSYTAGGRVDSPPTIWKGHVLFGCADGWVYCLRASDGILAWRFRAAPQDKRIVAYEQVESLWPVPGSVLVHNGVVYCGAGRSSYLDGSIRLYRLDAKTGRMLSETVIDDRDPNTGYQHKGVVKKTDMPGALPDILSCDGESVFMRHARFDLAGQKQPSDVPHLFSAVGFLDGSWWHRTYWLVGTMMGSGWGRWPYVGNKVPAGRLLAFDDSFVYGFGRNQYSRLGAHVNIDSATVFPFDPKRDARHRFTYYRAFAIKRESGAVDKKATKAGKNYFWNQRLPVLARAMVLAGDYLFLAGPADIFSSDETIASLEGKKGGLLCILSALDGKKLAQYDLDSPPVFDGMAAAGGRLYFAATDGSVSCFCEDM